MGLRIERGKNGKSITGVTVTPEPPEALSAEDALLTVVLDPSRENLKSGARHADQRVRWAVALHPHLTADVAEDLASDDSDDVKRALASNPSTPTEVLEGLGQCEDLVAANSALRTLVARLKAR